MVLHLPRNIGDGFPCKTCEIDAQISRVRHGNDREWRRGHAPGMTTGRDALAIACSKYERLPF